MSEHIITIGKGGVIEMIDTPTLVGLHEAGTATKTRASHVLPCNPLTAKLFKFLRNATGEVGIVSEWTRRWPWWLSFGWQVQIVDGPHLGTFWNRADAIAAEVKWIEANRL